MLVRRKGSLYIIGNFTIQTNEFEHWFLIMSFFGNKISKHTDKKYFENLFKRLYTTYEWHIGFRSVCL